MLRPSQESSNLLISFETFAPGHFCPHSGMGIIDLGNVKTKRKLSQRMLVDQVLEFIVTIRGHTIKSKLWKCK